MGLEDFVAAKWPDKINFKSIASEDNEAGTGIPSLRMLKNSQEVHVWFPDTQEWVDISAGAAAEGGLPIVKKPGVGIMNEDTAYFTEAVVYYQNVSVVACEYRLTNGTVDGTAFINSGQLSPSSTWNLFTVLQAHLKAYGEFTWFHPGSEVNVYGRYKTDYLEDGQEYATWSEWSDYFEGAVYIVPELSVVEFLCYNPKYADPLYGYYRGSIVAGSGDSYPYAIYQSGCNAASVGCLVSPYTAWSGGRDTGCSWSVRFPGIVPGTTVRFTGNYKTQLWSVQGASLGLTPFLAVGTFYGTRYYGSQVIVPSEDDQLFYTHYLDISVMIPDENADVYFGLLRRTGGTEDLSYQVGVRFIMHYLDIKDV
jgi:hypothetical protein